MKKPSHYHGPKAVKPPTKKPQPSRYHIPPHRFGGGQGGGGGQGQGPSRFHQRGNPPAKPAPKPQRFHSALLKHPKKPARAKKPSKRGLALADDVACCAAEALAASLRATGQLVSDVDVLGLYWRITGDPDAGASIVATLDAALTYGLAGVRPVGFAPVDLDDPAAVLLGVDLPGPHAIFAAGGQWASWGAYWPSAAFPHATIEEAWQVTW